MIYLILSILLYSINNFFWKKILEDSNIWLVISLRSFFTVILGTVWYHLFYPELKDAIRWNQFKLILIASILGAFGLICMVSALKKGSLRQLGIFNLITVFVTVSYLIVFENLNIKYYLIGSFFIICGFIFYLIKLIKDNSPDNSFKQYLLLSLMALFFSFSGLLHWYNLKASVPVMVSLLTQESTVFCIGIFILLIQPHEVIIDIVRNGFNKIRFVFIMAMIIFLAVWFGFMGLKITDPIVSSLLSLSVPIITILFGSIFFKEKINSNMVFSLLLVSVGAFLLYLDLNYFYN
jgi:drug/metabolite transporter (DMT)-like permease